MNRLSEETEAEILLDYQSNVPFSEICERHGVSAGTVQNVRKRHGVALRPTRSLSGESNPAWRGGKPRLDALGYRLVWVDPNDPICGPMRDSNGRVREHRVVMARHLKRPLRPDETVHHIDGFRLHNVISNLQLRVSAHGAGRALCCGDCGSTNITPQPIEER